MSARHRPYAAPRRDSRPRCDRCGRAAGAMRTHDVTALGRLTLCRDCEAHARRRGWIDAAADDASAQPARSDG